MALNFIRCFKSFGKSKKNRSMDQILNGLLKSNHPEKLKYALIKNKIAPESNKEHDIEIVMKVFGICWDAILNNIGKLKVEACKEVYVSWTNKNKELFLRFFDAERMEALFDGTYISDLKNNIWVAKHSANIIKELDKPAFLQFCNIFTLKIANFLQVDDDIMLLSEICLLLTDFPEIISRKHDVIIFSTYIIKRISKYDSSNLTDVEFINKNIAGFLKIIWEGNTNCLQIALQTIFESLSNSGLKKAGDDKYVSYALAGIVDAIPVKLIPECIAFVCSKKFNDGCLLNVLTQMMDWLRWPNTENISEWILSFLTGLDNAGRHNVLLECIAEKAKLILVLILSLDTLKQRLPPYNVLYFMMLKYEQPLPTLFHSILPDLLKLLETFKSEEDTAMLKSASDLIFALMHIYSGFPDVYSNVNETLKKFGAIKPDDVVLAGMKDQCKVLLPDDIRSSIMKNKNSARKTEFIGLLNEGNTCYINSVVQALYMCISFRKEILKCCASSHEKELIALQNLFAKAVVSGLDFVNSSIPPWLKNGFGKRITKQQDASEYLSYLLDQIQENCKMVNIIDKYFLGEITVTYKCGTCSNTSEIKEPFRVFNLPFQSFENFSDLKLYDLLDCWHETECLVGDDQYSCSTCNQKRDAERSQTITKLSEYFIITLNRFKIVKGNGEKIRKNVNYPKKLVLKSCNNVVYGLTSVVVHNGYFLNQGHYYTYARTPKLVEQNNTDIFHDDWLSFNDTIVRRTDFNCLKSVTKTVNEETAYILIYRRIDEARLDIELTNDELSEIVNKYQHIISISDQEDDNEQHSSGRFYESRRWDKDDDNGKPPDSCGGGGGFSEQDISGSKFIC